MSFHLLEDYKNALNILKTFLNQQLVSSDIYLFERVSIGTMLFLLLFKHFKHGNVRIYTKFNFYIWIKMQRAGILKEPLVNR